MNADEARKFKLEAKIAFVVVPKPPYIVKASFQQGKPTIRNPREIRVDATVLIADIQCALLMNGNDTVVAAFETR